MLMLLAIVLVNTVSQYFFKRFDLTQDKRYSLNNASIEEVESLTDYVFIKVYLTGDMPADYKKLERATKEILDDLKAYGGENIQYEFINPSASNNEKIKMQFYETLTKQGLQYSNIRTRTGDTYKEQIIFPGAIISYGEKSIPVQLLKNQMGAPTEVIINNSIQQLEYTLMSGIRNATNKDVNIITFLKGHGEYEGLELEGIKEKLEEFYQIEEIELTESYGSLQSKNLVVIAGPDSAFSEKNKFIIDQFIMKGGKVIWLFDGTEVNQDSLQTNGITMGLGLDLNLDDMIFKYGARVNKDLIMDVQGNAIPVVTGMVGDQPKQEYFAWPFAPLFMDHPKNPISHNLDAIKSEYVSTIDLVGDTAITKTPLLLSSPYTKVSFAPTRVSLSILRDQPDRRQYNKGRKVAAVLLEGKFTSLYKNRLPQIENNPELKFLDQCSKDNSMIVIADANIIKNDVNQTRQEYYPLGYDKLTRTKYANDDFILNCVNYLTDDKGLIESRNKEFKIRLLDKQKIQNEEDFWKYLNLVGPLVALLLFGWIQNLLRKRKYTTTKK